MVCKLCGTQLEEGQMTCPNCGHVLTPVGRETEHVKGKEKRAGRARAAASSQDFLAVEEEVAEPDVGVEPVVEKEQQEEQAERRKQERQDKQEKQEKAMPAEAPRPAGAVPVFNLDAAGLRKVLARQPEILEPGLSVLTDDKGKPIGVGFSTGVGSIDLLARDSSGTLVVVSVGERGQGEELVSETLQRIGWVRKHLAKGKQNVRGVVLVEQAPENLSYTASAVAGTITFKTFSVAVTFENVEI